MPQIGRLRAKGDFNLYRAGGAASSLLRRVFRTAPENFSTASALPDAMTDKR